jgi:GDP-L-fucose synthase
MKILILGGHGFIGSKISNTLSKIGHDVLPISRKNGVDLTNYSSTKKCFNEFNPEIIINCAANVGSLHYVTNYPADVILENIQMTLNMYKAAKEVCPNAKFINPIANCSYPSDTEIQKESEWLKEEVHESVFAYGYSKRFIYIIAKCYKKQYEINSINFIVPNAFGPGDSIDPQKTHALNGIIIRMIQAKKRGDTEFEIWGTGSPIREWVYIDDVVNILMKGLNTKENLIYPVNLAQNKGFSIKQSTELIAKEIGFEGKIIFNTNYQDGAKKKILDDKQFRKLFPDFKFHNHKKGITETIKYYKTIL